jgi:putative phosphoesterase
MRIALLADIHGNTIALDAVLKDIEAQGGVDGYWLLGDYSANGFDPAGVLDRLMALPNAAAIYGNADRYSVTDDRPFPSIDDAAANPALLPVLVEVAGNFGWVRGYLQGRGSFDWMRDLPMEHRTVLPDGTRVLLVHGSPGTDADPGLHPAHSDAEVDVLLQGCEADLICVGHFHMALDRTVNGRRVINPGPVSNAFAPDLRASYAILDALADGHSFSFHRVEYDIPAAIEAIKRSGSPGAAFAIRFLEGKIRPWWMDKWDGIAHLPAIMASMR